MTAPHVIVAGAGSAGLASAVLMQRAGAQVTVLEPAPSGLDAMRGRGSVVIGHTTQQRSLLRELGVGGLLDDVRTQLPAQRSVVPLTALVSALEGAAVAAGVQVRYGASLTDVTLGARGVSAASTSPGSNAGTRVHADWLVDATGGRSELARSDTFRRSVVDIAYAQVPEGAARDAVPFAWEQVVHQPRLAHGVVGAQGAFGINDALAGTLTAYAPWPERTGASPLKLIGMDPVLRTAAGSFTARQQITSVAAHGRVLLVGDSVGTVLPATQLGVSLALDDAVAAARAIGIGTDAAIAEYDVLARTMRLINML